MTATVSFLVNTLSMGMGIFLAAAGLTLLFGILKLLNFAHGAFMMIGAYLVYSILGRSGLSVPAYLAAAVAGAVVVAILGYIVDKLIFSRLRNVDYHYVLIASFALMLACNGVVKIIWGLDYVTVSPPPFLDQPLRLGDVFMSRYSVFLIVAGILVFIALDFAIHRLWAGKLMQSLRSDAWMSGLMGLNVPLGLTLSVVCGFFLAGLAGGLLLPNQSLSSHMGDSYLLVAFFAVIIGGLGNVRGAFVAALLIAAATTLNSMFLPTYPGIGPYILLTVFLLVRPRGIFPTLVGEHEGDSHASHGMSKSLLPRKFWQGIGIAVAIFFYAIPCWANGGLLFLAGTAVIHGLFALSWNLLFGYAGLAAFGHAAFFGIGAYLTGALMKFFPGIPFLPVIMMSALAGAILAWCLGELALRRLSGIFLAILTIALGEIVRLFISYSPYLGREDGLVSIPRPKFNFPFELSLATSQNYYWFMLTLVLLLIGVLWWVAHGRFGRVLLSIRQDAERASFVGINVPKARIQALMLSGSVAAVSGALYAPWARIVTLDELHWMTSVQPVLNSMLGGINSFWGPLLGASVFTIITYGTRMLAGLSELIVGLLLLGIILGAPNGLVGLLRTIEHRLLRRDEKGEKAAAQPTSASLVRSNGSS